MTGYLYILKHGIGPGTMPNDVTILKEKDLPNYYTAVWLDRFLTTSELKQYDIPSETRINELLSRIDYCQADNGDDVVPCDEIKACGDVMASEYPSGTEFNKLCDYYAGLDPWISLEEIWDMVNADHGNKDGLADDITAYVEQYRNCMDEGIDPDDVEACDKVTASKIVASKMSDIDLLMNEALECTTKDELGGVISGLDSLGLRKLYLHYMEMLRDDSLSVGYIASDLSDTLYNMFSDKVNACGDVMASHMWDDENFEWEDYGDPDSFGGFASPEDFENWYQNLGPQDSGRNDVNAREIDASTKPKYFANMVSASEFDSFDDEYGVHRVSKADLNYVKNSIYERVSNSTDIPFSLNISITKQLPDAIAKVFVELNNLSDGTKLEYDDRIDSNSLEGTIQRMTKYILALITNNWSEYPDNITDADEERITGDIYDEIETTIFDYYLYGTPELLTIYSEEDPTFLYNIEIDNSDMPDSLTIDIKLEALDRDDLEGLVEDYLKPITSNYNTEYTIESSKTGRTGKTGYIHIKFQ